MSATLSPVLWTLWRAPRQRGYRIESGAGRWLLNAVMASVLYGVALGTSVGPLKWDAHSAFEVALAGVLIANYSYANTQRLPWEAAARYLRRLPQYVSLKLVAVCAAFLVASGAAFIWFDSDPQVPSQGPDVGIYVSNPKSRPHVDLTCSQDYVYAKGHRKGEVCAIKVQFAANSAPTYWVLAMRGWEQTSPAPDRNCTSYGFQYRPRTEGAKKINPDYVRYDAYCQSYVGSFDGKTVSTFGFDDSSRLPIDELGLVGADTPEAFTRTLVVGGFADEEFTAQRNGRLAGAGPIVGRATESDVDGEAYLHTETLPNLRFKWNESETSTLNVYDTWRVTSADTVATTLNRSTENDDYFTLNSQGVARYYWSINFASGSKRASIGTFVAGILMGTAGGGAFSIISTILTGEEERVDRRRRRIRSTIFPVGSGRRLHAARRYRFKQ